MSAFGQCSSSSPLLVPFRLNETFVCRFEIWDDTGTMFIHETSAAYTSPITVGQDRSVLVNFNSSGGFEILDVDAATGNTTDVSGDTTAFLTPVCTCMHACFLPDLHVFSTIPCQARSSNTATDKQCRSTPQVLCTKQTAPRQPPLQLCVVERERYSPGVLPVFKSVEK